MTDEVEHLEARVDKLEAEIERLQTEAKEREVRQLKWGIRVLGALVITMASWIWTQIGHLFDFGVN